MNKYTEMRIKKYTDLANLYNKACDFATAAEFARRANKLKNSLECKPQTAVAPASMQVLTVTDIACAQIAAFADKNKKEETMSLEHTRLSHLTSRLMDAYYAKKADLRKHFHMDDDQTPQDAIELIERIQAGKFIMPKKEDLKNTFGCSVRHQITWRDPNAAKDEAGYDAAKKAMKTASDAAMDIIVVKSADEGLAAYQDFASKTFH